MAKPPLSVGTLGVATDLPAPISSWGTAVEPPPSTGTPGVAVDPLAPTSPEDGPMLWPVYAGLTDSLPPAWNGKGPCVDEWVPVSESSPSRTSHSTSATTSSSLSLLSSLSVSSPGSRACCFCYFFFRSDSFVFLYHSAMARLSTAMNLSFGSGARQSIKTSFFGWSRYPNVSTKGSGIQVKRRHG